MASPNPSDAPDADAYASRTLDHHGLVAGMVDELGLVGKIDAMIPQDIEQRKVSVGMAVKAMILVGLGFVQRTLYLTPHFFKGKPVGRLLGPGILAEHLNDDALGRALDAIYDFGVEVFYYLLAAGAAIWTRRASMSMASTTAATRRWRRAWFTSGRATAATTVPT